MCTSTGHVYTTTIQNSPTALLSLDQVHIPITRFCYKEVKGYGSFQYKLYAIKKSRDPCVFNYPLHNIVKSGPTAQGLKKVNIFNNLYVPQCNSISIQFEISNDKGEIIQTVSPNSLGKLVPVSTMMNFQCKEPVCDWKFISTSDLAFSISSMVHSFVETSNGFYHVGISLLPACSVFMPVWLSQDTFSQWLEDWHTKKMTSALQKSIMAVSYSSGNIRVQSLDSSSTITTKWLVNPSSSAAE